MSANFHNYFAWINLFIVEVHTMDGIIELLVSIFFIHKVSLIY